MVKLSFFNWSLIKLLSTESSSFNRAKIKILFTILVFTVIKLSIAIAVATYYHQPLQLTRAIGMTVMALSLLKLLLAHKRYTLPIAHIIVWIGLLFVWSNIFIFGQDINLITLQFVFTIILSSFYLLGTKFAILYSLLSILPLTIFLISGPAGSAMTEISPSELASPGYEIIILLNLVTFVITNYLYHDAFRINISEKEDLNHQLKRAVEEANRSSVAKSDFLSTMSHELRTPLNSVIGMTQLLLDEPCNAEQAENLKVLKFSAANLHSLINDILDFNKLGADKLTLEAINVDLCSLMNDICSGLRLNAKEKGLELILDIDKDLHGTHVVTDPTRLAQIIYNLAGNAIKFTPKGSVAVKLRISIKEDEHVMIRFSVIDTGIGINADKRDAIFEPFMQASTSTTRNFGGTGLGLAIVKRLLMLFNSTINLESTPGAGSHFYFDIGFKTKKILPVVNTTDPDLQYDLKEFRVLVAEDNPMNQLLLKKVFSKWNNEPDFANNGYEALEKLTTGNYDVILMDIHMPLMDGYEATLNIRNLPDPEKAGIPVIALTASVSNNLHEKIKEAGMNDYIYKPFNSKELYSKLKIIALESSDSALVEK